MAVRQAILRLPQETVDQITHLPGRMEALVLAGWLIDAGFVPGVRFDVLESEPGNSEVVYVQDTPEIKLRLWRPTER